MPELPEVETVCRGLRALLPLPCRIEAVHCRRPDLRRPIPPRLASTLQGRQLCGLYRRAKYLLFNCEGSILINHLGMTGSWRELAYGEEPGKHDHLLLTLTSGQNLAFRDPRRFGLLELTTKDTLEQHPLLASLGPEPLSEHWDGGVLFAGSRRRACAIKSFILDQRQVVGVGNIYAAESCFRAGIDPRRKAGSLSRTACERLAESIKTVLEEAIAAGGSTISDFRQAGGSSGYFQHRFQVYGRAGQACLSCGRRLRGACIAGRSTVFCTRCQR